MSKDKNYRRLIGSHRWSTLAKRLKTDAMWTCSRCGRTTSRLSVHHVTPVESARNDIEMERLCFAESNLEVLCFDCHAEEHKRMRSHAKDVRVVRNKDRVDRFFMKYISN